MSPLWFISAAAWFKNNKPLIFGVLGAIVATLVIFGLMGAGYHFGKLSAKNDCRDTLENIQKAADKDRALRQALSDEIDAESIAKTELFRNEMLPLAKRLANETNNPAYRCKPTVDGLRLLNSSRAAASKAAGQRDD